MNAALAAAQAESQALAEELRSVKTQRENYLAELRAIAEAPPPKPDTSEWEQKLAAAQFEMKKWQAAYDDAQARLSAQPSVDINALTGRLEELQQSLAQSLAQQAELQKSLQQAQGQHAEMHARIEQLNQALSSARKYETVGRLTGDVAQDFAQMLGVINGALEILARQGGNEQVQRLSEAALAAGRRGERLTRQLQAFQSEDY
jgi:signal transduction histidine kinase